MPRFGSRQRSPRQEVETWFLRRGLPHFVNDYQTRSRAWARAAPFLTIAYLLVALPVHVGDKFSFAVHWGVALAVPAVAWIVANLIDRRPPFAAPNRFGPIHLIAFVVGPALTDYIQGEWWFGLEGSILALVMVAIIYPITTYGVFPMFRWVLRRFGGSLGDLRSAAVTALPLMLLFVTFLLYTEEIWMTFGNLRGWAYGWTLLLFTMVGLSFVAARLRPKVMQPLAFDSWEDVREAAATTPAAALPIPDDAAPVETPITVQQRRNMIFAVLSNQMVMALAVAVVMGLFFLALSVLTVDAARVKEWSHADPSVWLELAVRGRMLAFTEQHLRVIGFLAAFSGFHFAVYAVSDPTMREELTDDGTTDLIAARAARMLYLASLSDSDQSAAAQPDATANRRVLRSRSDRR
jgi:hypothetical protein